MVGGEKCHEAKGLCCGAAAPRSRCPWETGHGGRPLRAQRNLSRFGRSRKVTLRVEGGSATGESKPLSRHPNNFGPRSALYRTQAPTQRLNSPSVEIRRIT